MASIIGEATQILTPKLSLKGLKYDVRELQSIAFVLRDAESLRGLYRLTFADGFRYAGLATNVVSRFAQHRKRWEDITSVEFFPIPEGDLEGPEKLLITATEQETSVRNIRDTNRPLGDDDIGITVEEQIAIMLPWDRERRVRPHQNLNDAESEKFAALSAYPAYPFLREFLGWYLYNAVPDPTNTQEYLWTISCLPSTGKNKYAHRLFTLSVGNLETFYVYAKVLDNGEYQYLIAINAERSESRQELEDPDQQWAYMKAPYNAADVDQLRISIGALQDAITHHRPIPQFEEFLDSAYKLNVKLMRSGSTMFKRFHNKRLASDVISASLMWQGEDWAERGATEDTANQAESGEQDEAETFPSAEVDVLCLIQGICAGVCDPKDLDLRKNKSYTPVLFQDNNRKTVARLYFNNLENLRVGIFHADGTEKIENIKSPEDLTAFARRIRTRVRALVEG